MRQDILSHSQPLLKLSKGRKNPEYVGKITRNTLKLWKKLPINQTYSLTVKKIKIKAILQYIDKIKSMKLDDIKYVSNSTQKQNNSPEWFAQRKGRITASKFRKVFTKMNSLKKDENIDHTKAISDLMGYDKRPPSDDMRFGISMEMHAKKLYKSQNVKKHKNLKVKDSGLVISETHPWIGASPDLLEIKRSGSLRNEIPTSDNYKHLKKVNKRDVLNESSEHCCQIQGQIPLTERHYTYFFVLYLKRVSLGTYCLCEPFGK